MGITSSSISGRGVHRPGTGKRRRPDASLRAWFKFDEGTGDICTDRSRFRQNATLMSSGGYNKPTWEDGQVGKCIKSDASESWAETGTAAAMDISPPLTFMGWLKSDDPSQAVAAGWGKHRDSDNEFLYGFVMGTNLTVCYGRIDEALQGQWFSQAPQPGIWYHVAATFDEGVLQLYLNGNTDNSASGLGTLATGAGKFMICKAMTGGTSFYMANGYSDDIKLYNRALSAAEIKAIYTREA